MRFEIKDLIELKKAVEQMDDDDRLSLTVYDEDKSYPNNKTIFAFRFNRNFIKLHEIRQAE